MDVVEVSREEVKYFNLWLNISLNAITVQVLEGGVFLCQLLSREFIFAPVSFSSIKAYLNNCDFLFDFCIAVYGSEDCLGRYN